MQYRSFSIKWKTFSVFFIFAIALLGVLWLFQIIYLKDFYQFYKRHETEVVLDEVECLIRNPDNCEVEIHRLAAKNNMGIFVTDKYGEAMYIAEYTDNSKISTLPHFMFDLFRQKALAEGGETNISFKGNQYQEYSGRGTFFVSSGKNNNTSQADSDKSSDYGFRTQESLQGTGKIKYTSRSYDFVQNKGNDMAESVIYVRIIEVNEQERVLMINSVLTPVDATVTALKAEIEIISFITVLGGFILAIFVARNISNSIINLNEGAKKLATGDYSVKFSSDDYKEVAELSDTLNYAARELGKVDRFQKELIANVSHDLRTPLTMIKGYAEVMRDIPGENTPENVQIVIDETERLSWLVNDMLDISKLNAGTITIHPEEYNLTESIRHVLERYNKLRELEGFNIEFMYDDEVDVYADEQKIYQVLYNLVNNAINYTGDDKRVTVTQKVQGNTVRIEVTDTGKGVSKEDIPYVWDRYYKTKTVHKRAVQGTGLGLSIVKNILELHGARYGVSSTKGHGATFWFELAINPFEISEEDEDI